MKLTSFKVTNFRNVIDSGEIAVEPDVTCLVGKNESGKTALLQALYRTKPVYASTFEESKHYPRQNLVAHRRKDQINKTVVVEAHFAVDDDDLAEIESTFGKGVLSDRSITTLVGYGIDSGRLLVSETAAIKAFVHRIMAENEPGSGELLKLPTLKELKAACEAKVKAEDAAKVADPEAQAPSAHKYRDVLIEMGEITTHQALLNGVWESLQPRIPQFFYFGEYNYLPGHIDLHDVASAPTEPAADAMQTARALLKLAGTSPSQLGGDDYEDRKAELEAVSNDLTRQMREYWHQSDEIEVTVDVEMHNEQRPNGQLAVARSLNVRVTDRRHGYSNNFDERSSASAGSSPFSPRSVSSRILESR